MIVILTDGAWTKNEPIYTKQNESWQRPYIFHKSWLQMDQRPKCKLLKYKTFLKLTEEKIYIPWDWWLVYKYKFKSMIHEGKGARTLIWTLIILKTSALWHILLRDKELRFTLHYTSPVIHTAVKRKEFRQTGKIMKHVRGYDMPIPYIMLLPEDFWGGNNKIQTL